MKLRERKEEPLFQSRVAAHLCRYIPTLNKSLFEVGLGWPKDLVLHTTCVLQFTSCSPQDINRK